MHEVEQVCACGFHWDGRVILVDQRLHCEPCGYPLPDDDPRQAMDGRKIINGWVTYPGVNRAGF